MILAMQTNDIESLIVLWMRTYYFTEFPHNLLQIAIENYGLDVVQICLIAVDQYEYPVGYDDDDDDRHYEPYSQNDLCNWAQKNTDNQVIEFVNLIKCRVVGLSYDHRRDHYIPIDTKIERSWKLESDNLDSYIL
jgi:hypothetical protein